MIVSYSKLKEEKRVVYTLMRLNIVKFFFVKINRCDKKRIMTVYLFEMVK